MVKKYKNIFFLLSALLIGSCASVCWAGINFEEGATALYRLGGPDGTEYYVEYAIIKKDGDNIWIQTVTKHLPESDPDIVFQILIDNPQELTPSKMLVQAPGQAPMWINTEGADDGIVPLSEEDARALSGADDTQTITTEAGTFDCVYIDQDATQTWISNAVGPLAIVKVVSANGTTMELISYGHRDVKDLIPNKPAQ